MIPFVYQNYDENNTYNIDDWQRVQDFDEFREKVIELKNPSVMSNKLDEYRRNYEKVLLSKEGYYEIFAHKMNKVFA